jgi:hypothetical protein
MTRGVALILLACFTPLFGAGCGAYALRGKVIEGAYHGIYVVEANDKRLNGPPVGGATVSATLDPSSLGRKPVGDTLTGEDGGFTLPIGEFGAGTLEYEVGVEARAAGHAGVEKSFRLPGGGSRLLIVMPRGVDRTKKPANPLDDLQKFPLK